MKIMITHDTRTDTVLISAYEGSDLIRSATVNLHLHNNPLDIVRITAEELRRQAEIALAPVKLFHQDLNKIAQDCSDE